MDTILYRKKVRALLGHIRRTIYHEQDLPRFPTDKALCELFNISAPAFSNINRCVASASGSFVWDMLHFLSEHTTKDDFIKIVSEYVKCD